ncbi:MAG TPA: hypothetical protein VGF40_00575 [Thermoanaerobaculia bacterium]
MSRATLERFGRIWLPAGAAGPRRFLVRSLFVPHGRGERIALALSRVAAEERVEVDLGAAGAPEGERFAPVASALASVAEKGAPPSWLFVEDYANGRGRSLVFFFAGAAIDAPFTVVKVRGAGAGPSLRRERDALERIGEGGMRGSVPAVRAFRDENGCEILALTAVPGASMYREMKAALLPRARVGLHFDRAAAWLERFQSASAGAHGDFWARNLLLDRGAVATVDWENFDAAGDPFADVVHFPLTYVLAFRWDGRDASTAVERFRRGFVERNAVSAAVAGWMRRFAVRRGSVEEVRRAFLAHLERGSAGAIERPQLDPDAWNAMRDLIRGGAPCAFSG